jgi:hypothetical protein
MSDKNDIYIECFPTGEDGKILFEENLNDEKQTSTGQKMKKIVTNPIFIFIGVVLGMSIIFKGGKYAWQKITAKTQV